MKNYKIQLTTATACAVLASIPAFGGTGTLFPARVLTPTEAAALPNMAGITTMAVTFKTAVSVSTSRLGVSQPTSVQRHDGMNSAVYSGTDGGGVPPAQPPLGPIAAIRYRLS